MNYDKLEKRIDDMLNFEDDNFLVNINLKDSVVQRLLDYQYLHVFNILTALRSYNYVLDGSDTGTGKTYTTIALCKQLNLKPFIICKKTGINNWTNVCDIFKVRPLAIVNYETIKNCKEYNREKEREESKFLFADETTSTGYRWMLPRNSIIIFDEVHCCKNKKTQNAKLLMSTKYSRSKVLLISATIADTPKSFHIFGYMLGFYKKITQGRNWVNGMLREDMNYIGKKQKLSAIHRSIFPFRGSRISIKDLGDKFPKNQVIAEFYDIDKEDELRVNKAFDNISLKASLIKSKNNEADGIEILKEISKARQEIELIKIPIFVDLVEEFLENNYSIVIFVNFIRTLERLSRLLKTKCLIYGRNSNEINMRNNEIFQNNESKIIIVSSKMSEGISLHDIHGGHPRVSLMSAPDSADRFEQNLGRIHRAESKSPALQRIIYCANTIEEAYGKKLNEKLKFRTKIKDDILNYGVTKK
jgi:superfamily II DNA or RNA helicase